MIRKRIYDTLFRRVRERRRFLRVLAGPRQVGKTTLARQVMKDLKLPAHYASADEPTLRDRTWIGQQWDAARFRPRRKLLVGGQGIPLEEFLGQPTASWLQS
jgi:predicted AAA+ superfamily ATPase